jgi:hypothetical protein
MLKKFVRSFSRRARSKRGKLFNELFQPTDEDKIVDLGGGNGTHFASISPLRDNVYLADIDPEQLEFGHRNFGFKKVLISEDGNLPFPDNYFDIIFCSSVIEHVTVPKQMLSSYNSKKFRQESLKRQKQFANEIRRVAKNYFVQTPYKYFPVESHTWLPFYIILLPRKFQIAIINWLNGWWFKKSQPDWFLLTDKEMSLLFPDAKLYHERVIGLKKSIMAVKTGNTSYNTH